MFPMTKYLLLLTVFVPLAQASESVNLTEKMIVEKGLESSPVIKGIRAQNASADLEKHQLEAGFETRANARYNYAESREDGLATFIPVFSPQRNVGLGLSKKLPVGMNVAVEAFGEQINAPSQGINNATRAGTRLSLEVDLLKNFFGRIDRNHRMSKASMMKKAEIQAGLDTKEFEMDIRKLYWSMVANKLSLQLSEQLVETARKQLRDAKGRARAGAADSGDVARSQAQIQSRESSVYLFQYEKEQLEFQLKKLAPWFSGKMVSVNPNPEDIDNAVRGVLSCVESITADKKAHPEYSDYFDVLELTKEVYSSERKQAEATGDWDLKLTSSVQWSGVDQGFSEAIDEYNNNSKDGYAVGLALSIPLEGDIAKAEAAQKRVVESNYSSQIQTLEQQIYETHIQVSKSLLLLQEAAGAIKKNVDNLQVSLKSSRRKYKQARISINEFVGEQDQLFSSQLNEISTKLAVIHALYDYFKVFNNHPCKLNSI